MAIPMKLALAPIVGFLFGWTLDRWWGTAPWWTLVLLLLGFVAGAREVWMSVTEPKKRNRS